MKNILVVAQLENGKVRKSTRHAIAFARQAGGTFSVLVAGAGAAAAAAELAAFGAQKLLVADSAWLNPSATLAPVIASAAKGFDVIVITASSFGKDIAPRVAAKLGAGYAPDVAGVKADGDKLVYKRPMFAGNAFGYAEVTTPVQVVSVRQSEFAAAEPSGGTSPTEAIAVAPADAAAARVEFVSLDAAKRERPDLGEAKVIVSGGRALKEKFAAVLEPLADQLGAAIGASRAACDAGYAPAELQVGQTGRIVAPALYLAIGISGAIQHSPA